MKRILEVVLFVVGLVLIAVPGALPKVAGAGSLVAWFLVYFHRSDPPPNGF